MADRRGTTQVRDPLSADRIVAAGVALADELGLEAVSMRRVGERLGVEAMSLYRHIGGKDALVDGMVDEVITRFPGLAGSPGGPWDRRLRDLALGAHATLRRHPWAAGPATARPVVGPAKLRFIDTVLGILLEGGASPQLAHDAMHALDTHVFAFTLQELRIAGDLHGRGSELDALLDGLSSRYRAIAATIAVARHDPAAEYAFVLDLIVDGVAGRIAESSHPGVR